MNDQVYTLIQQTRSPDSDQQCRSARALATCDLSAYRVEAIKALCELLKHEQLSVREAARDALIQIDGADVVNALLPYLRSTSTVALNYAIEILSQIGDTHIEGILDLLESRNHDLRKFGCDILGNLRYRDSVYDLIELLNDPHINVAIASGEALGKLGSREAVPYLIHALQYPDSWMRCIAAEALGKIGDLRAVDAFYNVPLDEEPIVLYTMIKAMGNLPDVRVIPLLFSLLNVNTKFASSVVQTLEQLVAQLGAEVSEEMARAGVTAEFVRLLLSPSSDVLNGALRLAGKLQLPEAVPALQRLLLHTDDSVVRAALSVVSQIETEPGVRPVLEQAIAATPHLQRKQLLQQALDTHDEDI